MLPDLESLFCQSLQSNKHAFHTCLAKGNKKNQIEANVNRLTKRPYDYIIHSSFTVYVCVCDSVSLWCLPVHCRSLSLFRATLFMDFRSEADEGEKEKGEREEFLSPLVSFFTSSFTGLTGVN